MKNISLHTMSITPWNQRILERHPKSEPDFWPDELKIKYMALEIEDLRFAVKEKSPTTHENSSCIDEYCIVCRGNKSHATGCPREISDLKENDSCILCRGHGYHVIGCPNRENSPVSSEDSCIVCRGHGFHVTGCPRETRVIGRSLGTCTIFASCDNLTK